MSEYTAVSNFFRNTQKLTREELKSIVKEVVGDVVRDETQRYLQTNAGQHLIEKTIKGNLWQIREDIGTLVFNKLIEKVKNGAVVSN